MKSHRLLILLVLTTMCRLASAQVIIGPVAGPQISWIHYNDKSANYLYKQTPMIGWHAGAAISFRVHNRFFLQAFALYSTKGKTVTRSDDPFFKNVTHYNYLDFPIAYTVEFKTKLGKKRTKEFKWYFGLGPNISYWLGGNGSIQSSNLKENFIDKINYKITFDPNQTAQNYMVVYDANRLQLGLNLNAGFVFEPFGYQKVLVTMRYELGNSFLSKSGKALSPDVSYNEDLKVNNHGFRLSAAYTIDLKTDQRKKGKSTSKIRRGR